MSIFFDNPFKGKMIKDHTTNPNIIAGKYSHYSGYYNQNSFDEYARFLSQDEIGVDKLIIGSFCSIGSGVNFIMAGNQGHRHDWISSFPFHYMSDNDLFKKSVDGYKTKGDTVIGNDVWIGSEAMIMHGVKIGDGAVIGSRSLVTKNVEPYSIVKGNPAVEIQKRFSDSQIKKLMEMKWWNWDEEILAEAIPILCSQNIDLLYKFYKLNILPTVKKPALNFNPKIIFK
ncbi:CatB-related O-acetyltransferase [Formosa undariae]|uniref:Chloramphenicol acetyltransferase n=1 Tax=Formosa undariae TaxID=1325436 RepID=A0ABV5F0H7_9FLAO